MSKKVRFHEVGGWSQEQDHNKSGTMRETQLNYFICTLGEASRWNREHPHPFHTVNDLIDEQAKELRQRPAVNFPGGCNGEDGRTMKSGRSKYIITTTITITITIPHGSSATSRPLQLSRILTTRNK